MLVSDIIGECQRRGGDAEEPIVARVLRGILLRNPDFVQGDFLNPASLHDVAEMCVAQVMAQDDPYLETFKMQTAHDRITFELEQQQAKIQKAREKKKDKLFEEIMRASSVTKPALDALYRNIVTYGLLESRMGKPNDPVVIREATAALYSVFPESELPAFMAVSQTEKEAQLDELGRVTTGIRLFNRDLGKGGLTLPDVPTECVEVATGLVNKVQEQSSALFELTNQYVLVLRHLSEKIASEPRDESREPGSASVVSELEAKRARLCDELINRRQYQVYLQKVHEGTQQLKADADGYIARFDARMAELRNAVKSRTAVPTEQVFPLFVALALNWESLRNIDEQLHVHAAVLEEVQSFAASLRTSLEAADVQEAQRSPPEEPKLEEKLDPWHEVTTVTEADEGFGDLFRDAALNGYCPWSLVEFDGVPIDGVWDQGLVRFKGADFACASEYAANHFGSNPQTHIEKIADILRRTPTLIALLHAEGWLPELPSLDDVLSSESPSGASALRGAIAPRRTEKVDMATETPVHFTEPNFEETRHYTWNEWELRRRALKLANLVNKRTHSIQTNASHFRRENATQHYQPKEQETQTAASTGTNTTKTVRYVAGLRGSKGGKKPVRVVNLTLDI